MNHETQCQRLLTLLSGRKGYGVTLPEILDLRIANYPARISELRPRLGIRCEEKQEVAGIRHTAYRLYQEPKQLNLLEHTSPCQPQRNPDQRTTA